MSVSQLLEVISENEADVTLTGGDPLMQIEPLLELAKGIKALGLNIWLYTGYTFEQIMSDDSLRRISSPGLASVSSSGQSARSEA